MMLLGWYVRFIDALCNFLKSGAFYFFGFLVVNEDGEPVMILHWDLWGQSKIATIEVDGRISDDFTLTPAFSGSMFFCFRVVDKSVQGVYT